MQKLNSVAEHIHSRRANVLFCDGHAEAFTFNSIFVDTSDGALRRWNADHEVHR